MKKLDVSEMRQVEGGKKKVTTYTCRCGYTCNNVGACLWHTATKHPDTVATIWGVLFSVAVKFI